MWKNKILENFGTYPENFNFTYQIHIKSIS